MAQISEEQKIMLDNLRRAVKEKVAPAAAENHRTGRFNPEIASLFWDLGLLEIMLPGEYDGSVAGLYTVLAKTGEKEFSFFIVERNSPGISIGRIEDKCGFRGSNTAEVILEDVTVPQQNLLGEQGQGFAIAMGDFDMSRPAVAALALGLAEGALDYTIEYARQRCTFGKPLIEHQAIQFILAEASTLIEASRGLMEKAALAFDSGINNTKLASMAKYFCSDAAMKITTEMVQVLGGYGYIKDFPIERMFRDAKLTQIFEGANQIQKMIIGRELSKM